MLIEFKDLKREYLETFNHYCRKMSMPPLLIQNTWNDNIWGVVALTKGELQAVWIGQIKGNKPILKLLAKSVWFDSPPVFIHSSFDRKIFNGLLDYAVQKAKKEKIVLFSVNHWSRQQIDIPNLFEKEEPCASIIIKLKEEKEQLWKNVHTKVRNIIRKGEKEGVEIIIADGENAIQYLRDFQILRNETQKRAIRNNNQTSMLLKQDAFILNLLKNHDASFFIAKYRTKVIAIALMIKSGGTIYYYMGGSDIEMNKKTGASSYLIWKSIEYSKEQGLDFFDMGGVPYRPDEKNPAYGVYHFKKGFGGEYKEFSAGKIIIRKYIYPILNFLLKNKPILRLISKNE
jgi:hypothetical protein